MSQFYSDAEADVVADNFFKYYYHDRGKIKWSGFFLSEHTAALKETSNTLMGENDYDFGICGKGSRNRTIY